MNFKDEFKCPICNTRHSLRHCRAFLQLAPIKKRRYINRNGFCFNCMGMSHQAIHCPRNKGCFICHLPHHTMLHPMDLYRRVWLQMSAIVLLKIPGKLDTPIEVKAILDPYAEDSSIFFGWPVLHRGRQFGPTINVVLTSTNNNVRTLTTTLNNRSVALTKPDKPLNLRYLLDVYPKKALADPRLHLPRRVSVVLGRDVADRIYMGLPILERDLPKIPFLGGRSSEMLPEILISVNKTHKLPLGKT
ncbi:uncharacterized protein LOC142241386 [Haematobia irritans]|uniref:uncharacterized protein LOC142241386 n=1 Tax=Haematobia irritans TaxID=7368 RepID=UPI003F4F546F